MNEDIFSDQVFFEPSGSCYAGEEASFLDIEQMFGESFHEHQQLPFLFEESPPPFEGLFESAHRDETVMSRVSLADNQIQDTKPKKKAYKSSCTKNVCFNICQKTIKTIKKGVFDAKLGELCRNFGVELEKFKDQIQRRKNEFTGPKALGRYVQEEGAENRVFVEFMRWFLAQKYLRIALNEGEMKDVKAYIEYKNQIILPLLQ